jgi:methylated-DNA-[protein]-cysteine S-methyltransferase
VATILNEFYYTIINLSIGNVGLVWSLESGPRLVRVILPDNSLPTLSLTRRFFPNSKRRSQPKIDAVAHQLQRYDEGKEATISFDDLNMNGWSDFYRNVWIETSCIPFGKVSTYGRVARNISSPGAARAVGTALSRNPFPLIIPCHRVIQSNGKLGGFSGGGNTMKRHLLEKEGVVFDGKGRICLKNIC